MTRDYTGLFKETEKEKFSWNPESQCLTLQKQSVNAISVVYSNSSQCWPKNNVLIFHVCSHFLITLFYSSGLAVFMQKAMTYSWLI